jgi:hypothetical protein
MNMKFYLFTFIVLLTTACGDDVPTVADGKKVLDVKYEKSECLSLISFDKKDGQKQGESGYKMWYEAVVELKSGCYGAYSDERAKFWSTSNKTYSEQGEKNMTSIGNRIVKSGEKVKIKGNINFSKTENGWKGSEFVF